MLPLIEVRGSPYEQGLTHGEQARGRIAHNLGVYFERFEREGKIDRPEALRRAAAYWDVIGAESPHYAETLRGIAEGSGCDLMELVALNVRYEILYHQFTQTALAPSHDGCTTLAVLPAKTHNGHLLMGENWDWIPQAQGIALHARDGAAERLCFTEAGIVGGKIGLNSHGLGLAINGLISTDDAWERLEKPFHVRCDEVLRSRALADAVAVVTRGERPCSANYLIAQIDDRIVNIEAAPLRTRLIVPENGFIAHTNHFLDPKALDVVEPPSEKRPHSYHRLSRTTGFLDGSSHIAVDDIQALLRDHDGHPYSICRHIDPEEPPEEHYQTVVSVVMDLHERAMWISDGPPCTHPYQEIPLS